MKKILRCCTIVLGVGMGLLMLAGVVLYAVGMQKLTKTYPDIPVETVNIPADSAAITRGQHIAIIWACTKCHGEDLSGKLIDNNAFSGTIPAANLTSGKGGIADSYTEADWIRAIRYGVKTNGHAEILMYNYSTMSDQDLADLLAYLNQLPQVDSNFPEMRFGAMLPIGAALGLSTPAAEKIDPNAPHPAEPVPGVTIKYGQYLSPVCTECHQAKNIGKAVEEWSQDDFIRAMQAGVLPDGKQISPAMCKKTFSELNNTELSALWLYFRSLQPPESQK